MAKGQKTWMTENRTEIPDNNMPGPVTISPPAISLPAVISPLEVAGTEPSTSRWTEVFLAVLPAIATNYGASNRKTVGECVSLAASLADEAVKEIERRKL